MGRFIAILPGYVEAHDYPAGRYLTLEGHLDGTRVSQVEQHDYVFPLVRTGEIRLWPAGFEDTGPQWHIGIGVGVHIR